MLNSFKALLHPSVTVTLCVCVLRFVSQASQEWFFTTRKKAETEKKESLEYND